MKILVTGGCGFIGSNFIRYMINKYPGYEIINLDKLTYAGNIKNLSDIKSSKYTWVHGGIDTAVAKALIEDVDAVVNFAAESHVDNSISGPMEFYVTNVLGTVNLLNGVVKENPKARFLQVSTDEVYGQLGDEGLFTEETPLDPSSPYSSSKASADTAVLAYHRTYGIDSLITRCSNNYGPYQYPEKLIPLLISNIIDGKKLPIYGNGKNVRDWIHVIDHCRGINTVLHHGESGEVYNIGSNNEVANIDIAKKIIDYMGAGEIEYVDDRPGHDYRYAIDSTKILRELGWMPKYNFEDGLVETIEWYKDNEDWWRPLK
jgi:dTDP-glucose 4,6-dehydratase